MVWQISTKITEDMLSHEAKPNFWVKLIQKQQEVIIKVKFPNSMQIDVSSYDVPCHDVEQIIFYSINRIE